MGWKGSGRLKKLLAERNQRQLARELNMDPSTLSKYASGDRSPDPDTLVRICAALAVSADEVLGLRLPKPAREELPGLPSQERIEAVVDAKVAEVRTVDALARMEKRLRALERAVAALPDELGAKLRKVSGS